MIRQRPADKARPPRPRGQARHQGRILLTAKTTGRLGWGTLWFSFTGRATRFDYWVRYVIPYVAGALIAGFLDAMLGTYNPDTGGGVITLLFVIAAIWPSLAVGVKRCHDRDRSGWFLLIGLIPIVGGIWLLIELGFLRGSPGSNRFGPDPLAGAAGSAAALTT
ncbi:MAG: DUF805 domain-containing protein [Alphaproteobacteria bacterium]|nr:DUF805 domain-containing protein [Alphaproteobacteria bacterium]